MAKVGIFFADGCEEIEGLAVVDICRRAGLEIETISIMGRDIVAGSHRTNSRQMRYLKMWILIH